jgi:hypothetical protein
MRSFFDLYFQGVYTYSGQKFGNDTSPNGVNGIASHGSSATASRQASRLKTTAGPPLPVAGSL